MLAKRTSKNQVTLPKAIVQTVGEADYYDVTVQDGKIVLTPVRLQQADAVEHAGGISVAGRGARRAGQRGSRPLEERGRADP